MKHRTFVISVAKSPLVNHFIMYFSSKSINKDLSIIVFTSSQQSFSDPPEVVLAAPPDDDLYPRQEVSQHRVIQLLHETLLLVSCLVHVKEVHQRLYGGA